MLKFLENHVVKPKFCPFCKEAKKGFEFLKSFGGYDFWRCIDCGKPIGMAEHKGEERFIIGPFEDVIKDVISS